MNKESIRDFIIRTARGLPVSLATRGEVLDLLQELLESGGVLGKNKDEAYRDGYEDGLVAGRAGD